MKRTEHLVEELEIGTMGLRRRGLETSLRLG